jgi:Flp pilus assembly protein TadG
MTEPTTEHGSAAVELVLLTPVLVALLLFVVMVGRLEAARGTVDAAARDAARAASVARSPAAAQTAAIAAANASTRTAGLHCESLAVDIAGDATAGTMIAATVTCTVPLGDLALGLHIPATRTITAHFVAPVDQYRGTS